MRNNVNIMLLLTTLCLAACSSNEQVGGGAGAPNSPKAKKERILQMEDSIATLDPSKTSPTAYNLSQIELINRLESYYKSFPKDAYSAECLFKLHMIYSGLNAQRKSVAWGDSLLRNFPNYANKTLLLESMASAYDMFITPRDTASVRKYFLLLLNDDNYPSAKKRDIKERLKYLHLTWMDFANRKQAR
jgi:hypothetical protein